MNEVIVRVMDLPARVNGVTIEDENGDYNVTINARCDRDAQRKALIHEVRHIKHNDFRNGRSIREVERRNESFR